MPPGGGRRRKLVNARLYCRPLPYPCRDLAEFNVRDADIVRDLAGIGRTFGAMSAPLNTGVGSVPARKVATP